MRISDWSSDVCSSDLRDTSDVAFGLQFGAGRFFTRNFSLDAEFNYMNPQKNNNDLLFTNYGASLDGRYHFIQDGRSWNPYLLLGAGLLHHAEEFELISNRSEEHTSELQSLMRISYDVFCLKKQTSYKT